MALGAVFAEIHRNEILHRNEIFHSRASMFRLYSLRGTENFCSVVCTIDRRRSVMIGKRFVRSTRRDIKEQLNLSFPTLCLLRELECWS